MRQSIAQLIACLFAILLFQSAFAQTRTVTGSVIDQNGSPLAGVTVTVRGTNTATQTDSSGTFSINAPSDGTLVFSFVGYAAQEVPIRGQSTITVAMSQQGSTLSEVVVVGYGTQRRIDVTGAVSQVRGEEIAKQASTNPVSALQGKVAGVQISNSGAPGASPQIRIRGLGTVFGNANPLYVVDGVWFDDISFLNPFDIENISILKDASSESIYGIRAANGVVLITTKKGRSGPAVVTYNGYVGVQRVTNKVEMASASQYATLLNEKSIATGGGQLLDPAAFGEGTDWYDVILRNAMVHNHQVSVSGGAERTTYNFSLGYLNQEGIVEGHNFDRFTAKLQNDFQAARPLKLGYTIIGSHNRSDDINGGIFYQAYVAPPVIPVRYSDGSYGDPGDYPTGNFANPQATIDIFNQESKNYRLTGNLYADLQIMKGLNFRSSIGGEYGEGEVRGYTPVYFATTVQNNQTSSLSINRAETRNWILENTLNYDNRFGDHGLKVLLGQGAQRYRSYSLFSSAPNVPNTREGDLFLRLGNTAGRNVRDEGDLSTIASYFGRVNYSFNDRYLLTLSMRADGSSKFAEENRWGYFPSVGAGWVITQEQFMANQDIFNYLKLRGSWGKIGNASVPANLSVLTVNQGAAYTAIFGGQLNTGASVTTIVPPTTYWERGVGTDIGLEASILDRRLTLDIDWYRRKTEEAIFAVPILGSLGTTGSSLIANNANFENKGWEFALNWRESRGSNFSYGISANLGINENEVLSVSTGANPLFGGGLPVGGFFTTRSIVGQPIGQFIGYQVAGIYQDEAQINSMPHLASAKPGDFIYVDVNKDGEISNLDRVVMGNPHPKYTYGINTNFTFREFDFTLDMQGVADVDVYNANLGVRYGNENYTQDFFDNRWHGSGTSNSYPSANINGDNLIPSQFYVEDGSYFRIRNIQLGYTLPSSLMNSWKMKSVRFFLNAQNAFNFFDYRGFSPEIGSGIATQSPTNTGIDLNVYPLFATYNFGVNVTF